MAARGCGPFQATSTPGNGVHRAFLSALAAPLSQGIRPVADTRIERVISGTVRVRVDQSFAPMPNATKPQSPPPAVIRQARTIAGLTQMEAAQTVRASLRAWQQWEADDRAMPPGLFELFMLKTEQWPLRSGKPARASATADK